MEQTLGKIIAANRKRLGMTQDQLAEKLGVTAQAVSKWENDQSCPDITILPKLAEIFGITTDELLGRKTAQIHEAEVVEEDDEQAPDGLHVNWQDKKGNGWEFKWDSGRRHAITFAVFVLLVGGLCMANAVLQWGAGFWDILWPSFLLVYGIFGLTKRFNFFSTCCALFGGYFLLANLGLWKLNLGRELIFPAIIVLFGAGLLVDALRKPKKPRFRITHKGSNTKTESNCTTEGEYFECSLAFGEETRYISLPRVSGGEISTSFGELTVDLSGCEEIGENCSIDASCSFGELTLLVPRRYRVEPDSSTSFGTFNLSGQPDTAPAGIILLDANVSFGEIAVRYI